MAVWYCNYGNGTNTGYYAVAQWAALTVYGAGAIVRQLAAPAVGSERCFRTTAGGTSGAAEPTWTLTKGGSTAGDGTVTWVEVTGNSTYNWSAPFARLQTAVSASWIALGDTVYVGNNHAQTQTANISMTAPSGVTPLTKLICVNAAGSVPPVSADLATSATCTVTSGGSFTASGPLYVYGITFTTGNGATLTLSGDAKHQIFVNSTLSVLTTGVIAVTGFVELVGTVASFNNTGGSIQNQSSGSLLSWRNTASAIAGTVPTTLFVDGGGNGPIVCDGVDLSAAGSGKTIFGALSTAGISSALINCRLGASVTPAATPTAPGKVELLISDSTNTTYRMASYQYTGTLTPDAVVILGTGGATDGVTPTSWKVVSTANATWPQPFGTFPYVEWLPGTGASITRTFEIINDGTTLTNTDVWAEAEYLGSASYPLGSLATTGTADILATGTNITTSAASWTTTGISSPVTQKIAITFTNNLAGFFRVTFRVAKASKTLWINPRPNEV